MSHLSDVNYELFLFYYYAEAVMVSFFWLEICIRSEEKKKVNRQGLSSSSSLNIAA